VNDAGKKLLLIGTAIIGLGMIAQAQRTQEKQFETAPFAHVISKEDEKSKKDWWDKADIVAKWLIAIIS
jgi:hypothetical protein